MSGWCAGLEVKMKRALSFAVGLPIISAIGAYYVSNITPYIVIFALIAVFVLVYTRKLTEYYPYYIFGLSLALLWGTSMLGSHIVGNDIHGEYYITNSAIQNGWNIHLRNSNNTSFIVGGVAPFLSHIIPAVWQYKLLYPFVFSWTPVLLYFGYRKLFDKRIALLSCLFIIIMPMFVLDMTSHIKGMVAELCLAALLPLVVCDIGIKKRVIGLSATVIIATVSHYTIGALTMIYLAGMISVIVVFQWRRILGYVKSRTFGKLQAGYCSVILLVSITTMFGYYSIVGDGSMLSTLERVGKNLARISTVIVGDNFGRVDAVEMTPTPIEVIEPKTDEPVEIKAYDDETLKQLYTKRTQPIEVTGTYLDNQEQLVRTALGLDFMTATVKGKIFRVIQITTQILIVLGVVWMLKRRKQFPLEYKALVIAATISLLACLFVPYLSTVVSATRFYQVALIFIAPAFIIGAEWIIKKKYIIATLFIAYVLFTTGFVFEVSQDTKTEVVNIPYSLSLSNYRMNFNGLYSEYDIAVAKWLSFNADKTLGILSDYNGLQLLNEYNPIGISSTSTWEHYYVFVTEWSNDNQLYVKAKCPSLRMYYNLPDLTNAKEVYRMGNAVAYEVNIG